ncbi:dihydrofolate reductase family protein [Streptosporangium longisporum]|uniref:Dihydrofolate reductase family protein n=1 Tax=Streptosporangium longisporum TaxID=46187 RepID=A0ABP6KBS6_9ACTN
MRKIISSTYMSLDGYIGDPGNWAMPYFDEDAGRFAREQLFASDALLMGRLTYEGFAAAWPAMTDEDGFADRMNSMPKYVASRTLEKAEWNNSTVIGGDLVEEITALKGRPGQDILMYGYGPVALTLLEHGLLDELRLWVHPIIVGDGDPGDLLFKKTGRFPFELAGTTTFGSGVVVLSYRAAARTAETNAA